MFCSVHPSGLLLAHTSPGVSLATLTACRQFLDSVPIVSSAESLIKGPGLKINFLKLKSIAITNINTDDPAALLYAAGQGLFLRLVGGGGMGRRENGGMDPVASQGWGFTLAVLPGYTWLQGFLLPLG